MVRLIKKNVILEKKGEITPGGRFLPFSPLIKEMQAELVWEYNLRKCCVNSQHYIYIYIYIYII